MSERDIINKEDEERDDDRKTASTHEVSDFPSSPLDSAWEWS